MEEINTFKILYSYDLTGRVETVYSRGHYDKTEFLVAILEDGRWNRDNPNRDNILDFVFDPRSGYTEEDFVHHEYWVRINKAHTPQVFIKAGYPMGIPKTHGDAFPVTVVRILP